MNISNKSSTSTNKSYYSPHQPLRDQQQNRNPTVDGRNSAPVDVVDIPVSIGFYISQWCRICSINSMLQGWMAGPKVYQISSWVYFPVLPCSRGSNPWCWHDAAESESVLLFLVPEKYFLDFILEVIPKILQINTIQRTFFIYSTCR